MAEPTGPFQEQVVANSCLPGERPKIMRAQLDFASVDEYIIDLNNEVQSGKIKSIQTLFVDNSANSGPVTITVDRTSQKIMLKAYTQAYIPILIGNPPVFRVRSAVHIVVIHMINVPMPSLVWETQ